jgi:hypothetical protein
MYKTYEVNFDMRKVPKCEWYVGTESVTHENVFHVTESMLLRKQERSKCIWVDNRNANAQQ